MKKLRHSENEIVKAVNQLEVVYLLILSVVNMVYLGPSFISGDGSIAAWIQPILSV